MRRLLAAAAALVSAVSGGPALADCSTEVALGVQAQGKQKFLRKDTQAISDTGPFKMVIEYRQPDRMRQIVTHLETGKPVETILVGDKAWTNAGDGWKEQPKKLADELALFMIQSSSQMYQEVGKFECLGAEVVEGRELRAYRGLYPEVEQVIDGKKIKSTAQKNEAVRMIYLDPATGLPARSIFAREGMLDKPLFKEVYTYPTDIEIEPPKDVKK